MARQPRKVNWFAIWVSIGVVVALVVVAVHRRRRSTTRRRAAAATGRDSARRRTSTATPARSWSASGESTIDTYIDFMCPICNQFEQAYGDGDPGPGRRRHDHPRHPPDRDPRRAVAGHRVLDARRERDVLRRGGGCRCRRPVHAGDVRRTSLRRARRVSPTSRSCEIASGVGVTGIDDCVNDGALLRRTSRR